MSPLIYVAHGADDARYHDELVRYLKASGWEGIRIVGRRALSAGSDEREAAKDLLLRADVIAILCTADLSNDDFCREVEIRWALARHDAGDALVFALQCGRHAGDPRLASHPAHLRLVPENTGSFHKSTRQREDSWVNWAEAIRSRWTSWHRQRRPRYDDDAHQQIAERLSRLYWRRDLDGVDAPMAMAAAHQELRRGGRPHSGDILAGRFWLLARRAATEDHETWAAYDREGHRSTIVSAHRGLTPAGAGALQRRLEQLMAVRNDAFVRVRSNLSEERGLGLHFFAMDASRGRTLHAAVIDREVDASILLRDIAAIGEALGDAHELGMVHGSVNPHMLLCEAATDGEPARPTLRATWPLLAPAVEPRAWPIGCSWEDDVHGWIRTAVFCVYGSELPHDVSPQELQNIIRGQACSTALKEFLASHMDPRVPARNMRDLVREYQQALDAEQSMKHLEEDLAMIRIPEVIFQLGAGTDDPYPRQAFERPEHWVRVGEFQIGRYPVTQRLFSHVMGWNPSAYVDDGCPVHNVKFRDAATFCNELSRRRGLKQAYRIHLDEVEWDLTANGYRLLTESEWELAAKGPNGARLFPWGDDDPGARVCWKGKGSSVGALNRKGPWPVWNHPEGASPYGVREMCGNVWEWCWDLYSSFEEWRRDASFEEWPHDEESVIDEVIGPRRSSDPGTMAVAGEPCRILRGGAWDLDDPRWMRTTSRSAEREVQADPNIGFRLALGAKPWARHVERRPPDGARSMVRRTARASTPAPSARAAHRRRG